MCGIVSKQMHSNLKAQNTQLFDVSFLENPRDYRHKSVSSQTILSMLNISFVSFYDNVHLIFKDLVYMATKGIKEADVCEQRTKEDRNRRIDVVKYNMKDLRLNLEDLENRAQWKKEPVWLTPSPEGWKRERATKGIKN